MVMSGALIICLFVFVFSYMYSPVPNAYFAKYIQNETQQDSSQSTASQSVTDTSVKQEAHPSPECTDEELMSALSQADELSETTANTSHDDTERISEERQTTSNLLSDCATESHDVSPTEEEQTNSGSGVSGEEGGTLVDEEMNPELSSEVMSGEQAEESNTTSRLDEAGTGTSHSSSTDHGNTTWISCTVGKMMNLFLYTYVAVAVLDI